MAKKTNDLTRSIYAIAYVKKAKYMENGEKEQFKLEQLFPVSDSKRRTRRRTRRRSKTRRSLARMRKRTRSRRTGRKGQGGGEQGVGVQG